MTDITSQLDIWAQRLRAIAMTGLAFEPQLYDRERYEELLSLAASMAATPAPLQEDIHLSRALYEHWRGAVGSREHGYVTPKVGVGAIVFNERDELLLIKRSSTHNWLFPTGWADVGYAPATVAAKEVREETGLLVTPLRLIGIFDSSRRPPPLSPIHSWSVLFYCRLDGGTLAGHPLEVLDLGFFARDQLPSPLVREGKQWIDLVFDAHHGRLSEPYFDPP